jgi:putative addiction module component (TIGR02574 family)
MSPRATQLLAELLALPADEREELLDQTCEALGPPDYEEISEAEFAAEVARRAEECRRDPSAVVPWEEVRRQLEAEGRSAAAAWGDAIGRRLEDVRCGAVVPVPWADARQQIVCEDSD